MGGKTQTAGRDLIREFVDSCRRHGIAPFFCHTTLDWHHPDFNGNFDNYLEYLRQSVEILCRNYGKIGRPAGNYVFDCVREKISSIEWMDNGEKLDFFQDQEKLRVNMTKYPYGTSYIVRVAKGELAEG